MVGGRVSVTVSRNEQSLGFRCESRVRQVTTVVPMGNVEPEGGVHTGEGGGLQVALSIGEGYSTVAPFGPEHSTVISPGRISVGVESSTKITSNSQLDEFPDPSVAVQWTVVVP